MPLKSFGPFYGLGGQSCGERAHGRLKVGASLQIVPSIQRLKARLDRSMMMDRRNAGSTGNFALVDNNRPGTDSQRTQQNPRQRPDFFYL